MLENSSTTPARPEAPQLPRTSPFYMEPLWLVMVVGAAIRLFLWLGLTEQPLAIYDERDYNLLAINLVKYGEFAFEQGQLVSLRPPLYPFVVSVVYAAFGLENFQAVRALQIVMALANALVVYHFAKVIYNRRVGLVAGTIFTFYPSLLGFNFLVLTETLFTLLLSMYCLSMARLFQAGSPREALWAGVCLGLGALTRSILWLTPPLVALYFLLFTHFGLQRRIALGLLVSLGAAVTIAPWSIRNTLLQKTFVTVDVMGGRNFMMGNYEYTPTYRTWAAVEMTGEQSYIAVLRKAHPEARNLTQGQWDKLAMKYALQYMVHHPWQTGWRTLVKFSHFWQLDRALVAGLSEGIFGKWSSPFLLAASLIIVGGYTTVLCLATLGIFGAAPTCRTCHMFFLLVVAYFAAMHSLAFAHSRYNMPLFCLFVPYAAAAIVECQELWRRRARPIMRIAIIVVGLMVVGWVCELLFLEGNRILRWFWPSA